MARFTTKTDHRNKNETAIAEGSKIQQLVADYRETGLSYSETIMVINLHCIAKSIPTITRSAVVSCKKRMVKEILPIIK
jgi:DNA-binding IclR family transcriptional regulator